MVFEEKTERIVQPQTNFSLQDTRVCHVIWASKLDTSKQKMIVNQTLSNIVWRPNIVSFGPPFERVLWGLIVFDKVLKDDKQTCLIRFGHQVIL